jgi:hypothetical protein
MVVIFESPTGKRKWRIEPYDNGMCFRILKSPIGVIEQDGVMRSRKNGKEIKGEWIDCHRFPVTLDQAVAMVVNLMLADPDDTVKLEFHGIDMKQGMEKIFKRWLKDVKKTLEVEDE